MNLQICHTHVMTTRQEQVTPLQDEATTGAPAPAGGNAEPTGPPEESSLRDQQQQLTRELILRSVAEQLEQGDASEITVPDIARAAGVSVRTVYRHFATREELITAAAEWISEHLFGAARMPETLDGVISNFREILLAFDEHPNLVRAMATSRAGNAVRSARRTRRLEAEKRALAKVTCNLPAAEQRQAEAIFGYLGNMLAWVTMRDENGLSGEEIGQTMDWAMNTLIEDLRRRNEAAGARPVNQPRKRRTR
jgi:AcrR family transcriptional regulator